MEEMRHSQKKNISDLIQLPVPSFSVGPHCSLCYGAIRRYIKVTLHDKCHPS